MCTDKKISKPIILRGILKTEKDIATILMVLKSMKRIITGTGMW